MSSKKKSKLDRIFSFRYLLYDLIKFTGAPSALLFFRPARKFIDKKAYKDLHGGYILSANHLSYFDPIIVHVSFPHRRIFSVASEHLFATERSSWFFRHINCIKVDRTNVSVQTMRDVGDALDARKVVCIFPEGEIKRDEDLATGAFKQGCAMMSLLNDAPILPVLLEKRKSIWNCTRVIVGKPIYPKDIVGDSKSLVAINQLNEHLYNVEQELYAYRENLDKRKEK